MMNLSRGNLQLLSARFFTFQWRVERVEVSLRALCTTVNHSETDQKLTESLTREVIQGMRAILRDACDLIDAIGEDAELSLTTQEKNSSSERVVNVFNAANRNK